MKYKFHCKKCGEDREVEMSVSEYADFDGKCGVCGKKMERVYEVPQFKGVGEGDSDGCDSGDCGSSCGSDCSSGSCASCTGCGF